MKNKISNNFQNSFKILSVLILFVLPFSLFAQTQHIEVGNENVGGFITINEGSGEGWGGGFYDNGSGNTIGRTGSSSLNYTCALGAKSNIQTILKYATCILSKSLMPVIFSLAILMFVWGVVQYVINTDDESKKEKGRQFMIWGLIALVIMVSFLGIVNLLQGSFGINNAAPVIK